MLDNKMLEELQEYIQYHLDNIYEIHESLEHGLYEALPPNEIEDFIKNNSKPEFKQLLFNFIDKSGETDSEIYKKAGIDRKLFSKIRSNPNYCPRKKTIIALAMALKLNEPDMEDLLCSAGYSLSHSDESDLIIRFCILKGKYNLDDVNQTLDHFSLKPLTGII